jgi:hypothetical protein
MAKTAKVRTNVHYVNNKEFLAAMVEYREKVLAAKAEGKQKPRVPNYIGECFVKIANHLAYKANFINYTYREEMVLDGIENCITYLDNFDPAKSSNPFAYFTQITYYAFLRRIQKEKKYMATKYRYIQNLDINSIISEDADGSSIQTNLSIIYANRSMMPTIVLSRINHRKILCRNADQNILIKKKKKTLTFDVK